MPATFENLDGFVENIRIILAISVILIGFLAVGIWANAYIMRAQRKRRMRGEGF